MKVAVFAATSGLAGISALVAMAPASVSLAILTVLVAVAWRTR